MFRDATTPSKKVDPLIRKLRRNLLTREPKSGYDIAVNQTDPAACRAADDNGEPTFMFASHAIRYLLAGIIFFAGMGLPAHAAEEFNLGADGAAIHGHDPVAYFTVGEPVKGRTNLRADFDGVTYQFANEENRAVFMENPAAYAPAYGGWCSMGVRVGRKFDIDPAAFKIVDQQLYLQLDLGTQKVWAEDIERNIAIADRIWPAIRSVPASQLEE